MGQFDPKLIICQIIALQSFYYVVMAGFLGSFRYADSGHANVLLTYS